MAPPLPFPLEGVLADLVARYSEGLEEEYARLEELRAAAARMYAASASGVIEELSAATAAREAVSSRLVACEARCRPLRDALITHVADTRRAPELERISTLHREAERLVAAILAEDRNTMTALEDAEQSRRRIARALDAGGASLVAYRRLIAPPIANAEILNQLG